jgi:trk system potassium uptake protein TrkA
MLTEKIAGQSVVQAGIRQKFKLNIIALEHDNKTTTEITAELMLHENDRMVVVGKEEHIKKFEAFLIGR